MDYPAALGCNNATGTRLTEIKQHDGQPEEDNRTKSRTRIHSKQSNNPQQAREINPQLISPPAETHFCFFVTCCVATKVERGRMGL
jgi:hypothetical protein